MASNEEKYSWDGKRASLPEDVGLHHVVITDIVGQGRKLYVCRTKPLAVSFARSQWACLPAGLREGSRVVCGYILPDCFDENGDYTGELYADSPDDYWDSMDN